MKFYGQLEEAALENLTADPSILNHGRIWYNTTDGVIRFRKDGTLTRAVLLNDSKLIIGNSATVANNVRLHRGGTGVLQFVIGSDTTVEGTLSTSLAQLGFRAANFTTAGRPAAGNAGRLIWDTDLLQYFVDNGTIWRSVGLADTNSVTTAMLQDDSVTSDKIAEDSILSIHIDDGQVGTDQIGSEAVTVDKLDITILSDFAAVDHINPYDEMPMTDLKITQGTSGGNVNLNKKTTAAEVSRAGTLMRRRNSWVQTVGTTTIQNWGFAAAPTQTGTLSANGTFAGGGTSFAPGVQYTTGAVSGNMGGINSAAFNYVLPVYLPDVVFQVYLASGQLQSRVFVGLCSATLDTAMAADFTGASAPAIAMVGFWWDQTTGNGLAGDQWGTCSSSGVATEGTRTTFSGTQAGAVDGLNTTLRITWASTTRIHLYINEVLAKTYDSANGDYIPAPGQSLGVFAKIRTLAAVAKAITIGRVEMLHN